VFSSFLFDFLFEGAAAPSASWTDKPSTLAAEHGFFWRKRMPTSGVATHPAEAFPTNIADERFMQPYLLSTSTHSTIQNDLGSELHSARHLANLNCLRNLVYLDPGDFVAACLNEFSHFLG